MSKKEKTILTAVFLAIGVFICFLFGTYKVVEKETPVVLKNAEIVSEIEVVEKEPSVLLGRAEISFAGGTEERNKNIELGISRINGAVVLPGEEFSFTKALGPVTEEEYSQAKIFLNNEVTTGLGGGLCQVSTTLFQSLIKAGLPITERHNHTYTVSYYDVGLDATYSEPGPDLKFLNDTTHPITIKGEVKDKKAIFEIYGVSDGRVASTSEVEILDVVDFPPPRYVATSTRSITKPECINAPQIGYTAKIKYGVLYADGELKEQEFVSTYKPLQRVCYVNFTTATSALPFILNN